MRKLTVIIAVFSILLISFNTFSQDVYLEKGFFDGNEWKMLDKGLQESANKVVLTQFYENDTIKIIFSNNKGGKDAYLYYMVIKYVISSEDELLVECYGGSTTRHMNRNKEYILYYNKDTSTITTYNNSKYVIISGDDITKEKIIQNGDQK